MKIITYAVLALFLIVGGLGLVYYVKSTEQGTEIKLLKDDLETTNRSLDQVRTGVAESDKIIKGLSSTLSKIDEKGSAVSERVILLERNNAKIRDFLNTRLPESGCLLDDSCANGVSATERSTADPVQPSPNP